MEVEKFPTIFFEGRKVIWDSRQRPGMVPEIVVLRPEISDETRVALMTRPQAIFVGEVGSGLDQEVADPRQFLAEVCAKFYAYPSSHLKVFGVTGTNGKTTCASILRSIFTGAGKRCAEIGTLGLSLFAPHSLVPELHLETGFTTPDAPTLQKLLADLLNDGVTHVVMELSSHAAALGRIHGLDLDGVLFTNLTQDHLDFHGSMAAYEDAKKRIFTDVLPAPVASLKEKWAVLNGNDPAGRRIFAAIPARVQKDFYGHGVNFEIQEHSVAGMEIVVNSGEYRLSTKLIGAFNGENLVGSAQLARHSGDVAVAEIEEAIAKFTGAKGRLERVSPLGSAKSVFVDYAHTPDALAKTLETLRELKSETSQLWVVFGCGGDRDRSKRPLMGRVAESLADRLVLTSDNPRSEDPRVILSDIRQGLSPAAQGRVVIEADRERAISHALAAMADGDLCVVAGKGHEEYQIVGQEKLPFSDQKVCREFFGS